MTYNRNIRWIDTGILIASPERSGRLRAVEVAPHFRTPRQSYVAPLRGSTPFYVFHGALQGPPATPPENEFEAHDQAAGLSKLLGIPVEAQSVGEGMWAFAARLADSRTVTATAFAGTAEALVKGLAPELL